MPAEFLRISGYRSIRDLRIPIGRINVLVGPNGCGKSNLYRALYLLTAAAEGRLARTLAEEGGLPSILWAGPRAKGAVRLELEVESAAFSYELCLGLPVPGMSAFNLDPRVKEEHAWITDGRRKTAFLERRNAMVRVRDDQGRWVEFPLLPADSESALSELKEPHRFPVLSVIRQEFVSRRFYQHFRTDPDSPMRRPQVGVRTPVLAQDGSDLAAALQTIRESGDRQALDQAIDHAFPGASLAIDASPSGLFGVSLQTPEFPRPFEARELSDGTLRYLALLAALLSPRPPDLLAFNEPETGLHPDLLEPLARLLVLASKNSRIWITTHSAPLADHVERLSGVGPLRLTKVDGETKRVQ